MRYLRPNRLRELLESLKNWCRRKPPEDPYAYVTAPKKPRPPHLSASAVAEQPDR
jgi:hypothetical protein